MPFRPIPQTQTDTPTFHLPDYTCVNIASNVELYYVPDTTQDILSLSLVFQVGAFNEKIEGLSSITSIMLQQSTLTRSSQAVATRIEELGATLRVTSKWDTITMSISGLSEYLFDYIDIIRESLLQPAFLQNDFERERTRIQSDILYEYASAEFLASRGYAQLLYAQHPYSKQRIGTQTSLSQITLNDCKEFYLQMIVPSKLTIYAAGNIHIGSIDSELRSIIENLGSTSDYPKRQFLEPQTVKSTHKYGIVHNEQSVQNVIAIGQLLPMPSKDNNAGLQFLSTMFGGSFSSRTNKILREEKGYTYGAFCSIENRFHASDLSLVTSVGEEYTADAIAILFDLWEQLSQEPFSHEEIERTRKFFLGTFARSFETPSQKVSLLRSALDSCFPIEMYQDFVQQIATLRQDELFSLQSQYLNPDRVVLCVAGKSENLQSTLTNYSPLNLMFVQEPPGLILS